jgi:hypothetical protein
MIECVSAPAPSAPGRSRLADGARVRQHREMSHATGSQGTLFGPATPSRRRQRPRQITVTVSTEAIISATVRRIDGDRVIAEAVRASRPRNAQRHRHECLERRVLN